MDRFLRLTAIFLVLVAFVPSLQAGRLLHEEKIVPLEVNPSVSSPPNKKEDLMGVKKVASLESSLILSALPKGSVPSSGPSKKVHSTIVDEKLFARHLERMDRILKSVPSPGAGH
ncbi:putative B-cell lymphoma 6 protein [Cinnamomum micranthum f. kanehirae]|uniref:Putative B-cell lymphoma 6 protein n=1 Tax=Cinnamomum micranthum f. kanehirae TaxID=337451 RepID=A0A443PZX1_9MAGN|nr:putative B-cell lymphoma 6 protein [Cinnamomum micranthum f. kanehirae]